MIQIREANRQDAAKIAEFQIKMALETENLVLDPEIVNLGVLGVFDQPHRGKYFVAVDAHETLGCLLTVPEWSDWRNGTVLWIHSVYVISSARKKGVFKELYQHLKNKVPDEYRGLRLYVDKTNLKAQKVYQNLGMSGEHYHLYEWVP